MWFIQSVLLESPNLITYPPCLLRYFITLLQVNFSVVRKMDPQKIVQTLQASLQAEHREEAEKLLNEVINIFLLPN